MAGKQSFNGVTLAEATRIVDYEFGANVIKLERNEKTQYYELHINNNVRKETVEKFTKYHKLRFKVKVYTLDYEM